MSEKNRLILLVFIMSIVSFILVGVTIYSLYNVAIEQTLERLVETAQSQARLIEAVARFDQSFSKDYPGGSHAATLAQIADAHKHYKGFGKTGEFTLARIEHDKIVFLLSHRHFDINHIMPVSYESKMAEPMRRALSGKSGTMIGTDYHGKTVVAAYEPLNELNLGIVTKIDLSEVREPFKRVIVKVLGFSILVILGGVALFFRITNPMIKRLENQSSELSMTNIMMKKEINERIIAEETLKWELTVNSTLSGLYGPLTSSSSSIHDIAQLILDNGKFLSGSVHGYVSSIDPLTGDNLGYTLTEMMKNQCNVSKDKRKIVFPKGEKGIYNGLWGHALNTKEAFFSNLPSLHESSAGIPEGHIRIERFLSVPVILGDELVGQISLANKEEDYTQRDLKAICRLGEYYALAIQRKRAQEDLAKAHQELEIRIEERTAELTKSNILLKQEIEQRREAEGQLRKNQNMLQMIFDGISDPLVLLSKNLNIKMLNKSAVEYYGINNLQDVLGEFCYIALLGTKHPCDECQIHSSLLKDDKITIERQGFMDQSRFEKVAIYPLRENSNETGDFIIRISDVTERKLLEKQLIQNEKMASLGMLVSSITHEINNPNSFISFNIPILKEYLDELLHITDKNIDVYPDFEIFNMSYSEFRNDILNLVNNIEHGSKRINTFVSNLKDFSRIKYSYNVELTDLNAVVEKALSICRTKIGKTIKSVDTDIPVGFGPIFTDSAALEHILVNLLINAAQAAYKQDSWIKISAAKGDSWLNNTIIEVKDNGCGIEEKNLKYIFDPFFTTKTSAEGTGLGLYVCHDLITVLKGRIEVETKLEEYTIFRVILPDKERRKKIRT